MDAQIRKLGEAGEQGNRKLEDALKRALQKIDEVARQSRDAQEAINNLQEQLQKQDNRLSEQAQPTIPTDQAKALQQSAEQLKEKPEADYSFEDWNTRAFDAYFAKQYDDAALYWKNASDSPNAVAIDKARALLNRADALYWLKRYDEIIITCKQLIDTYSSDNTPAIHEQVAKAMVKMGFALRQMEKPDEAIATYKKVIDTYSSDNSPAIRKQVAWAMNNMGFALEKMGKTDEVIATYKKVIDTYSSDNTPAIREQVAKAMYNMGVALGKMGKSDEKIDTYKKVIGTYSSDSSPAIREQVATAMNGMGFVRLMEAKKAWPDRDRALALLREAQTDLLASLGRWPEYGSAHGNLAYVLWLLGEQQAAEESFRTGLAATEDGGEELYRGTLDDIAQHPLAEDAGFRAMVEGLWAEYQAKKAGGK